MKAFSVILVHGDGREDQGIDDRSAFESRCQPSAT
jgi:hypothetical protein